MSRIIAIGSGKGGTGKTTITTNLGLAIGQLGKKVVLVDADLDMANLELALGMEGRPITLQDVLGGEAQIEDAIYDVYDNVRFVPAGISPSQFKRVDPERLAKVISGLGSFADVILLDCPAGVGRDTIACLSACKETILVMTPEPMSATDAYKTKVVAEKMGSEVIGVVVNMAKGLKNELKDKEITSLLGCAILAKIPDNAELRESVIAGKPLMRSNPDAEAASLISKLASDLIGESYIPEKRKKSLLERLFGFKRKR